MDIKELIKFQMVSQFGMNNATNQQPKNLFTQLIFMTFMSILDDLLKVIPNLFRNTKQYFISYFSTKVQETIDKPKTLNETSISLQTKHFINSLSLTRIYTKQEANSKDPDESNESNQMVDAVISQISKLTNVPSFKLIGNGQIMVTYKDKPIQLTKDIYFKIDELTTTTTGNIGVVKISLLSNNLCASEITNYVKNLYNLYLQEIKNALGNNIYFFDQKSKDSMPPQLPISQDNMAIMNHKRMMLSSAPKQLSFTITPFYSNKQFTNVFGKQAKLIEQRVKFFIDNKDWYDSKGIPYQLGILLSGILVQERPVLSNV